MRALTTLAYGIAGATVLVACLGARSLYLEHQAMKAWIIQVQQNSLASHQAQQPREPKAGGEEAKDSKATK